MNKKYRDLDEIPENENIQFTRDDIFDDIEKIEVNNHFFVLTGTFTSGKRGIIQDIIKENGGIIKNQITKDINYLVVGEVTSQGWKYKNYGTKIEQADILRKQGCFIKIIPEQVLMKSLKEKSELKKDEFINIFLAVEPISYKKETFYETLEEEIVYFNDIIDDFEDALNKALKSRVKYFDEKIREIRYFYEQLPQHRKEQLKDELEQKLKNYISKSLSMNFESITKYIASAKRIDTKMRRLKNELSKLKEIFGEFYNSDLVKTKIEEFEKKMIKEIENE